MHYHMCIICTQDRLLFLQSIVNPILSISNPFTYFVFDGAFLLYLVAAGLHLNKKLCTK